MPKGFLVKRSKKTGPVSYRIRDEETTAAQSGSPAFSIPGDSFAPVLPSTFTTRLPLRIQNRVCFGGLPDSFSGPSFSPTRPDSEEYQYPPADTAELNSLSPTQAECLPEPDLGSFAVNGSTMPSLPEMTTKLGSICNDGAKSAAKRAASKRAETSSKKRKPSNSSSHERRPICRDEVTMSPVLGLRIKEDPDENAKHRANTSSPLGEFICQLCKERYSDPLTLAHHKCSRIVRVEYRCTECDKAFSCPANLASHRRWHKPRDGQTDSVSPQQLENPATQAPAISRPSIGTPSPNASDSSSDEDMPFCCPQCSKKFRRQAYLRKHLALHYRKAVGVQQGLSPSEATKKVCKQSSPAESRFLSEKESVESFPTCPAIELSKGSGDVFPCRFCGDNFFSSPGLTRHINKHHPTENRLVIFLPQSA